MKVLLIDSDGVFPNLALMKLSGYFKELGHEVKFGSCNNPDEVYISCVFTWNREKALSASTYYPDSKIFYGGSGLNLTSMLSDEVEHHKPDYGLYNIDYSMGFLTRGCIRDCGFCVVPEKEGGIRKNASLEEFLESSFNKIMILDNNLLAYREHNKIFLKLIDLDKKVSFSQGLDIRLIDDENARLLSKIKYYDIKFKNKRLYFAWDFPETEIAVKKGIQILFENGIRPDQLMFYVLMCYNTNYQQDIHRVKTLIELGIKPYVMLYNNNKGTYQRHLQRWVARRYYEVIPWESYDSGDSQIQIQEAENQ